MILPVLIKGEEIFVYDNNFFYNNWISSSKDETNENIEYIFPLEDLETIELIKKNQNNLENIKLDDIFEKDNQTDNILLIIDFNKKKTNFFLKGKISSKKIIKNFVMVNKIDNEIKYSEILDYLKKEILELIKSQNIIDVGTPSFLNVTLSVDKQSDLFLFQNILSEVDLVESFSVMEFNNKFAYVKIKYYGKINNLRETLKRPNEILLKFRELTAQAERDENLLNDIEYELVLTNIEIARQKEPWQLISEPTIGGKIFPSRIIFGIVGFISKGSTRF